MASFLQSFYNFFFSKTNESEVSDTENETFLAEQLLDLELSNPDEVYENEPEEYDNTLCFQRTGLITYIGENGILIDGSLYYEIINTDHLNVNDRISYLGYKKDDDTIKIVRIIENLGIDWGDHIEAEENKYKMIEHVMIGEVDYREERNVFIKDNDLKFNLDEVEATFIPMKGDWLELSCTVQWDENTATALSNEQVIKVSKMKALRNKAKCAKITFWDGENGVCDNTIYFDKQSLQSGADPQIGNKVILDAIESNQGACQWRAIRIIPDNTFSIQEKKLEVVEKNDEDVSLETEQAKCIELTYPVKFESLSLNETASMVLNVKNNSSQNYTLLKWVIMSKKSDSQVTIKPFIQQPLTLRPNQKFSFSIVCQPKFLGNSKELFILLFKGFQLKRYINVSVFNNDLKYNYKENRKSEQELVNNMKNIRKNGDFNFVPGIRPVKPPNFVPVRLGAFNIPDKVWSAVLGDSDQTVYGRDYDNIISRIEEYLPCLTSELNIHNYTDKWHTLLYMEEVQQNIHMRHYDIQKTFLDRHQEYLSLEIKGLSERRPSLIQGDKVIVKDIWDSKNQKYEGFIHMLKGDIILIKFHPKFHEHYAGSDVSIEFHFSRSVHRRCHQAINLALSNLGTDLLFPSRVLSRKPQINTNELEKIVWFNKHLNDGQKVAVKSIIRGESRPMPYCIYGPPGTGKTITVIETILQILAFLPDSRILVATPSNSAANLVTERLLQYRSNFSDSIIRLIANHLLGSDTLPDAIKPYCATLDIATENTKESRFSRNKDGINVNCHTSFIGRHRVTIGTCICLGSLALMGLPKGHFTHIIVDEAGQATEPEILIPMTFTDKENGQIILAGDPMQLGPVVLSKYCQEFGMDESYLSRLLERFPYQKDYQSYRDGYDSRLVTRLIDNYRSLEEVLVLPSQMFYDGTLIPNIKRDQEWINHIIDVVSQIFSADEKSGGIYVYGIRGINARAEDSPSWFNPQEASMVALTVCKLYKNDIKPDDIGVITPYIAQIRHLRLVFDAMGLVQPKIGTVEEFQGQERPIILISTVRSTESHLADDHKHTLGFVKHPKRLNVALTRAQVACILFCNPHLLCKDQLWNKVIVHSVKANRYAGCDLPLEISNYKIN